MGPVKIALGMVPMKLREEKTEGPAENDVIFLIFFFQQSRFTRSTRTSRSPVIAQVGDGKLREVAEMGRESGGNEIRVDPKGGETREEANLRGQRPAQPSSGGEDEEVGAQTVGARRHDECGGPKGHLDGHRGIHLLLASPSSTSWATKGEAANA